MKKSVIALSLLLTTCTMSACSPAGQPATNVPQQTNTAVPGLTAEQLYDNGYSNRMLVGIDQFARTFDIAGIDRENKDVGMFFWLWLGQPTATGVYDATKILEEYGKDVLFYKDSDISPDGQAHWWGEPLWGYYNSTDEFVIRKQIELLTDAGIDFIVFDATNQVTFKNVYTKVVKIIDEFQQEGWNPPKVAFYTHSRSMETAEKLYNEFYSKNLYPNTWYCIDGKPMIIAYTDPKYDIAEAKTRSDNNYAPQEYSQEILDFFHFKQPIWPFEDKLRLMGIWPKYDPNEQSEPFPWIEWKFPQPMRGNMMSVTVASHPNVPMSSSITHPDRINWGRGYDVKTKTNISSDAIKGTFFQSQWDNAISNDPDIVFVGGWNEWIAIKQPWPDTDEYQLVDAASMEYSRDIEMMKGGYNDAFYIQLTQNVRKYKGTSVDREMIKTVRKTIDINAGVDQWTEVDAVYRDVGKENFDRNSNGAARGLKYTQDAARNNLQTVKITRDDNYLYFFIESDADITANDGKGNWMNIFLTAGDIRSTGWICYDYVINRSVSGNTGSIEKLNADGTGTKAGEAEINVTGSVMQVKIPRNVVGMENSSQCYFKVADGVEHPDDIMDYYVTGRCLPIGRLSYSYGNSKK